MHKVAMVFGVHEAGASTLISSLAQYMAHYPGIDVGFYNEIDLSNLDDNEILFLLGHASPTSLGEDDKGGDLSGTAIGNALVKQHLPPGKKFRIRIGACSAGLYGPGQDVKIGKKTVQIAESFTRDLKNVMTKNKMHCTIEAPLGTVRTTNGVDLVNDPAKSDDELAALTRYEEGIKQKLGPKGFDALVAARTEIVKKMQDGIRKKPLATLVTEWTHNKSVNDPAYTDWEKHAPEFCFKGSAGWRIVPC